jgi:hypothetical protein
VREKNPGFLVMIRRVARLSLKRINLTLTKFEMKRFFFALVLIAVTFSVYSQKSVDALFNKYTGNDGFTTITINGNLLKLIRAFDDDDDDDHFWPADISTVRILAQEDDGIYAGNFFEMVERELDRNNYEEFMRVKNSDHEMVMLVRADGRGFREFLVVAGDDEGEDNVLIQIKGNMTYKEAKEFADRMKRDDGVEIVINSN